MSSKRRRWERMVEDDPLAGLINLFDVWMVFSIALLLALVVFLKLPHSAEKASAAAGQVEPVSSRSKKLPRYRISREEMTGEGIRLGTAYRLKSGEVVYVPDEAP